MLDSTTLSLGGVVTSAAADATSAQSSLQTTYSQFLTLLTTQLQNQDPLDPMDSDTFTQQLISMSGVEQQIAQTSKLDDVLQATQSSAVNSALSYIGKQVDYVGGTMQYTGSPVALKYSLNTVAEQAQLSITDSSGNVVLNTPAQVTAGGHEFDWDGKDGNGDPVPAGDYTVAVGAVDATGASVTSFVIVPATVTGVETDGGAVYLNVGDQTVPISSVQAVREMPASPATDPTTDPSTDPSTTPTT
jgi:flagellar basal-body rod modification protein FlgD